MIETIVPGAPNGVGTLAIAVGTLAIAEEVAAKAYGRAAKSARTRTEYDRDWAFAAWFAERGLASVLARYHFDTVSF